MEPKEEKKGPQSDDSDEDFDNNYQRFQSKRTLHDIKKRRE